MEWKYAYASIAGTNHITAEIPCQDTSVCRIFYTPKGEKVLIAAASDGAGSVRYAEIGSRLACSFIIEEMKSFLECGNNICALTRDVAENMIMELKEQILRYAEAMEADINDFACTLLCAVVGVENAVFFQVGDGAIVTSMCGENNNYSIVFWPNKDEYENTTYYVVDGECITDHIEYKSIDGIVDEIAVFTDGLQRLALHYKTCAAYNPFFRPLFSYLRMLPEQCSSKLQDLLSSFLNSKVVNERTSDDKTLIIASRCE